MNEYILYHIIVTPNNNNSVVVVVVVESNEFNAFDICNRISIATKAFNSVD